MPRPRRSLSRPPDCTLAPGYCWHPELVPDEVTGLHRRAELDEHTPISERERARRIRAEVRDEFRSASRVHR